VSITEKEIPALFACVDSGTFRDFVDVNVSHKEREN